MIARALRTCALVTTSLVVASGALAAPAPKSGPAKEDAREGHHEISLVVGETTTLSAVGIKNYSEGAPGIVDVRVTPGGDKFVLVGRKAGATQLLFIRNDGSQTTYDIVVSVRAQKDVEIELQQLLQPMPNVTVRRVGARFILEGGVGTAAEQKRVEQIAALYPSQVESLVTIGVDQDRRTLVRIDFFFVQYNKIRSYAVGLGWPASVGGTGVVENAFTYDFVAGSTTTATASIVNQPLPRLDIASRNGWAKVLKQSTIITGNGNEALFESGGEQNFLNASGLTSSIAKISFGTNVTVLPRFDFASKDVEIKLAADVSDLTAPAQGTIPGRTTTKLQSTVTLRLGQALILSGIRTQSQRKDITGLPLLSDIPILGLLFGSHTGDKEEVEGAIFIIPSVVDTAPRSALDYVKNAVKMYDSYSGEIEDVNTFPKSPPSAK